MVLSLPVNGAFFMSSMCCDLEEYPLRACYVVTLWLLLSDFHRNHKLRTRPSNMILQLPRLGGFFNPDPAPGVSPYLDRRDQQNHREQR